MLKKLAIMAILVLAQQAAAQTSSQELATLEQQAKSGKPNAELAYAKALLPSSKKLAFQWAQKAADHGSAEAWYWMGTNSSVGNSIYYYKKAAALNYAPAYGSVVDYYLSQEINYNKAKEYADLAQKKHILIDTDDSFSKQKHETINACAEAGVPVIPQTDYPSQSALGGFKGKECDSYFFGLGVKKDLVKYRHCLLANKESFPPNISLAEIYANGWGVARNAKLAIGLMCYADGLAPAELYGVVKALHDTQNLKRLPKDFYFCDYITSGANMGRCAAREERVAEVKRANMIAGITAKWPVNQQRAFAAVQKAADDFFDSHSSDEQDMSGTARNAIAIGEKSELENNLIKSIQSFERGNFPTKNEVMQAERALNIAYTKVMNKDYSNYQMGTITKENIAATQRAWLKYRDAWLRFVALRYPNVKPAVWRTWLTEERTKQLNAIAEI